MPSISRVSSLSKTYLLQTPEGNRFDFYFVTMTKRKSDDLKGGKRRKKQPPGPVPGIGHFCDREVDVYG